jgi:toxin YoeB
LKLLWVPRAIEDYRYWQATDPRIAGRIRMLVADVIAHPFTGIGKPEPLKHSRQGYWSRRITGGHRLVYRIAGKPPGLRLCSAAFIIDILRQ